MAPHTAKAEHEVAYQDLCALVSKHADKLTAIELLAVAANMLGKLVAMQDQRTTSPEMAMKVVSQTLQRGNHEVLSRLARAKGGTA